MLSEKVYRALLAAYPTEHRREYEEPMVQLFRDRMRTEGGGFRTLVVWTQTMTDLMTSAFRERMEGSEMQTMLTTTLRTVLEPRRRWSFLALVLVLLGFVGLWLSSFPREANYSFEAGMLQGGRSLDEIVAERTAEDGLSPADSVRLREQYEEYRLETMRLYSILHAPNSIQLVAQMMVTGGALFAVSLGVVSGRAARSSTTHETVRRWTLVPYFAAPMILWTLLTVASVGLGLLGGLVMSSLLTLEDEVVENSISNLAFAVLGIWLAGFMWSAIGVSLGVLARSAPKAFVVGIVTVAAEVSIGSFVERFTVPAVFPTYGAISVVSIDAPELFHGLLTPMFGHPLNGVHPAMGVVLLVGTWVAAVGVGLRLFSKPRVVEGPLA